MLVTVLGVTSVCLAASVFACMTPFVHMDAFELVYVDIFAFAG